MLWNEPWYDKYCSEGIDLFISLSKNMNRLDVLNSNFVKIYQIFNFRWGMCFMIDLNDVMSQGCKWTNPFGWIDLSKHVQQMDFVEFCHWCSLNFRFMISRLRHVRRSKTIYYNTHINYASKHVPLSIFSGWTSGKKATIQFRIDADKWWSHLIAINW